MFETVAKNSTVHPRFGGNPNPKNNIQNFCNFQKHMSDQVQPISPDTWTQMMTNPSQAVQNFVGNYAQQSGQILVQMQEQMAKAMGLKK